MNSSSNPQRNSYIKQKRGTVTSRLSHVLGLRIASQSRINNEESPRRYCMPYAFLRSKSTGSITIQLTWASTVASFPD